MKTEQKEIANWLAKLREAAKLVRENPSHYRDSVSSRPAESNSAHRADSTENE
jgi:hypothetical protein